MTIENSRVAKFRKAAEAIEADPPGPKTTPTPQDSSERPDWMLRLEEESFVERLTKGNDKIDKDRVMQIIYSAELQIRNQAKLLGMTRTADGLRSLSRVISRAVQDNLELDGYFATILGYGTDARYFRTYQGDIRIMRAIGFDEIKVEAIYPGDHFKLDFSCENKLPEHIISIESLSAREASNVAAITEWNADPGGRAKLTYESCAVPLAYWACASNTAEGRRGQVIVVPIGEIHRVREKAFKGTDKRSPWVLFTGEMYRKTVLHRLIKYMGMTHLLGPDEEMLIDMYKRDE